MAAVDPRCSGGLSDLRDVVCVVALSFHFTVFCVLAAALVRGWPHAALVADAPLRLPDRWSTRLCPLAYSLWALARVQGAGRWRYGGVCGRSAFPSPLSSFRLAHPCLRKITPLSLRAFLYFLALPSVVLSYPGSPSIGGCLVFDLWCSRLRAPSPFP